MQHVYKVWASRGRVSQLSPFSRETSDAVLNEMGRDGMWIERWNRAEDEMKERGKVNILTRAWPSGNENN